MRQNLSIEEESKLWKELTEIIIKNANREIEEWLKEHNLYLERGKENESS